MQTIRIVLGMLGALATTLALRSPPNELPLAPAPIVVPTGAALLASDRRLDSAPLPYEYAYNPTLGWRTIVAPSVPEPLPTGAFSDLGPFGGTPALELGSVSTARTSDDDPDDPHPVPD